MDSESPPVQSFEPISVTSPDTWAIDRIILLPDAASAELFLREVFPHFTNCLVASADRMYPVQPELNALVFRALEEKEKLRMVVFGFSSLGALSVKTERILVLEDLLMQKFKRHQADRELALNLGPGQLAFFIEGFFTQWDRMQRIGNAGFAYANYKEYVPEKFDWRAGLLGIVQPKS